MLVVVNSRILDSVHVFTANQIMTSPDYLHYVPTSSFRTGELWMPPA